MSDQKTIFKRIIDKEIPANIVHEDDHCMAFHDVAPATPIHVLVIPKKEVTNVSALTEQDAALAGHLMLTVGRVARQLGLEEGGYRVVANCGADGGQTVDHLHFHILGGRALGWPPG